MARSKVTMENRKRVPQACNTCRKRKQKCDGLQPCKVCRKRNVDCQYRLRKASKSPTYSTTLGSPSAESPSTKSPETPEDSDSMDTIENTVHPNQDKMKRSTTPDFDYKFSLAPVSDAEKLKIHGYSCMVLDYQKRFTFVGNSAIQSFMAWIKDTVRDRSGPSDFTEDRNWSQLPEAPFMAPQPLGPYDLPRKDTTVTLVKLYFTKTSGFIDVLNQELIESTVNQFYSEPNRVLVPDKCLLYLTLSIGLALGDPQGNDSHSHGVKDQLFAEAEALSRPYDVYERPGGHYDASWFLQVLVLMAYYMLATSRRNLAYEYCGRAVRRAYTLGIHRGNETEVDNFAAPQGQRVLTRNIWRSLFILDRFLAASLGRPVAVSDNEYSDSSLASPFGSSTRDILDPAVEACQIIGQTLNSI